MIIVILFSIISYLYIIKNIEQLTNFINSSGSIRGGVQRVTKLYLMNQDTSESIQKIDDTILSLSLFVQNKGNIFNDNDKYEVSKLRELWAKYNTTLLTNDKINILNESEYIWKLSNIVVNNIEKKTHMNIALQYLYLFLLFVITCMLCFIGFFIKNVVQDNIERKASRDQLTNLLNRNYLPQIYNAKLTESNKKSNFLALLLCDIDHFKLVNDSYGHDVGDKVLKDVADILIKNTRDGDAVFRYGGEEFLILVSFNEISQLINYAERLRKDVESSVLIERQLTISIGVSLVEEKYELKQHILHADTALYKAKKEGRNRVIINDIYLTTAST